jgi:hypothetical protein
MASEQKLVRRWSETRLFGRLAYKMENMKLLMKSGMLTGSIISRRMLLGISL